MAQITRFNEPHSEFYRRRLQHTAISPKGHHPLTLTPNSLVSAIAAILLITATTCTTQAEEAVIARVNGQPITATDLQTAAAEIGGDLGSLPATTKRRVLAEYLIENELMAQAAIKAGLSQPASQPQGKSPSNRYWTRRGLRESYFYNYITGTVSNSDARKFYDQKVASSPPEKEVKARHILVKTKDKAIEIFEKIAHGADFADMASRFSNDPGTKFQGGLLGYFGRGRMVPQFEQAAFKLAKGEVSEPVQTQYGWHLIKVDDTRTKTIPKFGQIKQQILLSLIHTKTKEITRDLRRSANIEYVAEDLKKQIQGERAQPSPQPQ